MTCPAIEQLAAASSGEAPEAIAHAASCPRCAQQIAAQEELIARARMLADPPLSAARRAAMAAETLARADDDAAYRGTRIAVVASLVAAAAIALVVLASRGEAPRSQAREVVATPVATRPIVHVPVATPSAPDGPAPAPIAAPPLRPASIAATEADFDRARVHGRDTIELHDGTLVIDARDRAPVSVVVADTTFAIANSRVKVVVVGGVIVTAHAFAGAVEMTGPTTRATIEAGDVWTPPPGPATSLAAFRAGWEALRAGRNLDAITAFDVATDPVVAEDAVFWAAVAATRANDRDDATRRFRIFLDRFPDSARAESARDELDRVSP